MSHAGCHSSLSRPYQILLYWILTEKLSERMDWLWLRWAAWTCSCNTLWYMLCHFARLFIHMEHSGCCPTCTIVCVYIREEDEMRSTLDDQFSSNLYLFVNKLKIVGAKWQDQTLSHMLQPSFFFFFFSPCFTSFTHYVFFSSFFLSLNKMVYFYCMVIT